MAEGYFCASRVPFDLGIDLLVNLRDMKEIGFSQNSAEQGGLHLQLFNLDVPYITCKDSPRMTWSVELYNIQAILGIKCWQ